MHTAVIGWSVAQTQIPAVDFVHKYKHVFAFKLVILYLVRLIRLTLYAAKHSSRI
jgi:hypothetical protein